MTLRPCQPLPTLAQRQHASRDVCLLPITGNYWGIQWFLENKGEGFSKLVCKISKYSGTILSCPGALWILKFLSNFQTPFSLIWKFVMGLKGLGPMVGKYKESFGGWKTDWNCLFKRFALLSGSEIRFPFSFRGPTPEESLLILLTMPQCFLFPLSKFVSIRSSMYLLHFFLISLWTVLFKSLNFSMFSCVLESFMVPNDLSLCLIKRLMLLLTHRRRCCF